MDELQWSAAISKPPSKRKEPNPTSMVAASKVADLAQNKVVVAGGEETNNTSKGKNLEVHPDF